MVQYLLYKKRDAVTPLAIVNENTIDSTTTSVFLVGKRKEAYGEAEQQSKVWMLENFANSTKPVNSILGQNWFNTTDSKLYACVNESTQLYEKVGKPLVSATAPSVNVTVGDLWLNTTDDKLYVFVDPIGWSSVGSEVVIPFNVKEEKYLTATTTNDTAAELLVNGEVGNRLVVSQNQTWNFDIKLVARVLDVGTEVLVFNFKGVIDRPNLGSVALQSGVHTEILHATGSLGVGATAFVSADASFNSLKITVVGAIGKTIKWNAISTVVKVTN